MPVAESNAKNGCDTTRAKQAARTDASSRRRAAFSQCKSSRACEFLIDHVRGTPGVAVVSAYLPIKSEISPLNAMHELYRLGKRVCLPVVVGSELPLRFREWRPGTNLEPSAFGTSTPARGEWLSPDLLIVPLLAFDRRGNRLGYGGGFYDRTIAELNAGNGVLTVGMAFAEQEFDNIPSAAGDRRLDAVATQDEVIRFDNRRRSERNGPKG